MSHYEQKFLVTPSYLRTKYSYLFDTIVQLYRFSFVARNEKISRKGGDVWSCVVDMHRGGKLSDYLHSSLEEVFKLHHSLLPGTVSKAFEENEKKERTHLDRLDKLLFIVQSDHSSELSDLITKIPGMVR